MTNQKYQYTVEELRNAWSAWVETRSLIEKYHVRCYRDDFGRETFNVDTIPSSIYLVRQHAWNRYVDIRDGLNPGTTHSNWRVSVKDDPDMERTISYAGSGNPCLN